MCLKTSVKSVFYWRKPTLLCPQQEQRHQLIGENVKEFKRAVECLSPLTWAYRPIRFQWWYVCLKKKKDWTTDLLTTLCLPLAYHQFSVDFYPKCTTLCLPSLVRLVALPSCDQTETTYLRATVYLFGLMWRNLSDKRWNQVSAVSYFKTQRMFLIHRTLKDFIILWSLPTHSPGDFILYTISSCFVHVYIKYINEPPKPLCFKSLTDRSRSWSRKCRLCS